MRDDLETLRVELREARETIRVRDTRIAELTAEAQSLRERLELLQKERPALRPEVLMSSFRTALEKMQEGLEIGERRVGYVVGRFDTDLKVNVVADEEGNISFQLPRPEDVLPAENLSVLHLSIRPVPGVPAPPPDTVEVPNLIGMQREPATASIEKAGLKLGQVMDRPSATAPGTVIGQDPAPYARTAAGGPVDLVVSRVREARVPNVVGMARDDAVNAIFASGLTPGSETEEASDSPPGTVIRQSPAPDTTVPPDTAVDLVISMRRVRVPNVIGMSRADAADSLTGSKLTPGTVKEEPSDSPPGTVIRQSITGDSLVPTGTRVDLVIAAREQTRVPDVTGMTRDSALRSIAASRLSVGTVKEEPSDSPSGTVIWQSLAADSEVSVDTPIDLTVARARVVRVPGVVGLPVDSAVQSLEKTGFRLVEVTEVPGKEPPGTTTEQKPEARESVPVDRVVSIAVSKAGTVIVPDLAGMKRGEAERVVRDSRLQVGRITRKRSRQPEDTVVAQRPESGKTVSEGEPVRLTLSRGRSLRR